MSSAGEYKEDAERIERDYVDPSSETREEVRQDLEDADFAQAAIDDIEDWIPTREDVEIPSTPEEAHDGGVMTREQVESAVSQAEDAKGADYSDAREDALTDAVSQEIGAPTQQNLETSQIQTVSESVTPSEVFEDDTRSTPVSVVRDTEGDVVGTVGSRKAGQDVAEEVGGEYLGDLNEYRSSMTAKPAPGGDRAMLYVDDEAVGEVDL